MRAVSSFQLNGVEIGAPGFVAEEHLLLAEEQVEPEARLEVPQDRPGDRIVVRRVPTPLA